MIPDWNMSGLLPPIRPNLPGNDFDRSPYIVNLKKVITQFATSPERVSILYGLLGYRKALHDVGMVTGFQWLDGSFMEHVERVESRPPKDIDVVTFYELPFGVTEASIVSQNPDLFDNSMAKKVYCVDAYFCPLGVPTCSKQVKYISYWYSMWSHRRDNQWKGFIQVDLSPHEDIEAITEIELIEQQGF